MKGRLAWRVAALVLVAGARAGADPAVPPPSSGSPPPAAPDPAQESAALAEAQARLQALVEQTRERFPDVPTLTVPEYVALADTVDVILVDTREPEERAVSWIPGSIPLKQFEENADAYRGKPVVCYCTIGYRSSAYTRSLRRDGWDARNLEGSVLAWAQSGRPVEGPDGPTRRVHVYGPRWNVLPPGWEGVW